MITKQTEMQEKDIEIVIDEQISLISVSLSDVDSMFRVIDNNRSYLKKWLGWVDFIKEQADQKAFVEDCINKAKNKSDFCFSIYCKEKFIGLITLKDINYLNKRAEIGYWLDEKYSGRGIMTGACKAVEDFAFNELELNRLTILTATENFASQKIAKKLGFSLEGTLRDNECLYGNFVDNYCFSLIRRK